VRPLTPVAALAADSPAPLRRRSPWPARRRAALKHTGLVALCLLMLYPLIWLLVSSFKPTDLIFRDVSLIPSDVDWTNYSQGWNALQYPFGRYLLNSAVIVLGSLLGNLVSCSMAAYAFARLEFRGRRLWFAIMLGSIMLPIHVIIVPQYILFARLDWINTFLPLIVPKLLATDAFFIFLMVQFFRGIPRELDEAARLDGCGHGRIYLRIMLPLSLPALASLTLLTFVNTWNDYLGPLLYLRSPNLWTIQIGLRSFISEYNAEYALIMTGSVLSVLPIAVIFLLGQRYFIEGVATSGLKG